MALGSNQNTTPKLHSLQITQSLAGISIPIGAGTVRLPMLLLWYGDFNTSGKAYNLGGKGLGKGASQYDYAASVLGALCHGPVSGIGNVWGQNGRLTLQSVTESYTVPGGGGTYTVGNPDNYNADQGVGIETPYSVTANDYGSPGPVTLAGTTVVSAVHGTDYTMPTPGQYTFPSTLGGQQVQISYTFSLYIIEANEDYNIPNTIPYEITVQQQTTFQKDKGVTFVDTGDPLSAVGGTPTVSGTYNPNGGNYLFAPADGLRPVVINYTWKQSNSSIKPSATLSFTLLEGEENQTPWSYLISKHLSQAIGYTTIACIAAENIDLGPSGQLENYNFEAFLPFQFGAGIVDADLAVWIEAFLTNQLWGVKFAGTIDASLQTIARDYWNANSFFASPLLDSARPAADWITEWCEAGNVGVYWSDNALKFIPYGDTTQIGNGYEFSPQTAPVVDLNDLDFITEGDEDPVEIERTPWQDAFNEVHIQYQDRANNYDDDSIVQQDDSAVALYGLRPEGQKDYSFLKTIAAAKFAANIRLKRLVNIRRTITFKISGIRYPFLEPMDMVTIKEVVTGLDKAPFRITEITEDSNRVYTVKAEEFPWGTATATLYPKQPTQPPPPPPMLAQPGDTDVLDVFEPPTAIAQTVANSPYQIWMALTGGPNWGGCYIMLSLDGTTYEQIGELTGTSRAGTLTAALPASASPDTTNTLAVETTGQLFNVTLQQAQGLSTLSRVGDEYLAYQNATLTGSDSQTNDYDLDYLIRGAFSTPIYDHPVGEPFVRIDSQLFEFSYNVALRGQIVYFKFLSFNLMGQMQQGLEDVSAYAYRVGGSNVSQNMTLTPLYSGGWEIEIYQVGQPVGTAGSATLPNGAVIPLPADTLTGLAASTEYWVSYPIAGGSYTTYTSEAVYLSAVAAGGVIGLGSASTGNTGSFHAGNPGYTTQPDGTVIEWGTTPTISGSAFASYPQVLPGSVWSGPASTFGGTDRITFVPALSAYGETVANNGSGVKGNWFSFGNPTGHTTLASGAIIQWGRSAVISGATSVSFPVSMPVTNPCVIVSTTGPTDRICYVESVSSTGFTVANNGSGCSVFWVAISAPSGEDTLSNGIVIKWGSGVNPASSVVSVPFTTAFPSNAWVAIASTVGPPSYDRITYVPSLTLSGMQIGNNGTGATASWLAVGN
jgi:hypothetical protein